MFYCLKAFTWIAQHGEDSHATAPARQPVLDVRTPAQRALDAAAAPSPEPQPGAVLVNARTFKEAFTEFHMECMACPRSEVPCPYMGLTIAHGQPPGIMVACRSTAACINSYEHDLAKIKWAPDTATHNFFKKFVQTNGSLPHDFHRNLKMFWKQPLLDAKLLQLNPPGNRRSPGVRGRGRGRGRGRCRGRY